MALPCVPAVGLRTRSRAIESDIAITVLSVLDFMAPPSYTGCVVGMSLTICCLCAHKPRLNGMSETRKKMLHMHNVWNTSLCIVSHSLTIHEKPARASRKTRISSCCQLIGQHNLTINRIMISTTKYASSELRKYNVILQEQQTLHFVLETDFYNY